MKRINKLNKHLNNATTITRNNVDNVSISAAARERAATISKVDLLNRSKHLTVEEVGELSVEQLRLRYGQKAPDALPLEGINHIAWVSSDMSRTLWFWSEILGLQLVKTLELPNNGQHFFLEGDKGENGNSLAIAYFYFPNAAKVTPGVGTVDMNSLITTGEYSTAHGSVNHCAFNVKEENLRAARKKLLKNGFFCSPLMYHDDIAGSGYSEEKNENTVWISCYFQGPDEEYLELTCQTDRVFTPEKDINHKPIKG